MNEPITIGSERSAELHEDRAAISDACRHFKTWLQQRPYPDYNTTDHLLRHPLEPNIMVVGVRDLADAAAFHHAVWQASMNNDNMPRLTVVPQTHEDNDAEMLSALGGLSPSDRVHRDAIVHTIAEVKANSQAAVFLPFTLDTSRHSKAADLLAYQTKLLQDLCGTLQTDGLVVAVSRTADNWKEAAQQLGYKVVDETPSKKDSRLSIITLQKLAEQPVTHTE